MAEYLKLIDGSDYYDDNVEMHNCCYAIGFTQRQSVVRVPPNPHLAILGCKMKSSSAV